MVGRYAVRLALLVPAFVCAALFADLPWAAAQEQTTSLATGKHWQALSFVRDGQKVCYMYSTPVKSTGNYKRRGDPNVVVMRREGSRTAAEVSVTSGYPYPEGKAVRVTVDGRRFDFGLLQDETAWADSEEADAAVVKAMIRGVNFTVRGVSLKGTHSVDTYSLIGFTKIHDAIVRACP